VSETRFQRMRRLSGQTHTVSTALRWFIDYDGTHILQQRCETTAAEVFWKDIEEGSDDAG